MTTTGRNEPCPCGSGKKYKHCHMKAEKSGKPGTKAFLYLLLFIALLGIGITGYYMNKQRSESSAQGRTPVWSEEHQHYH